MRAVGQIQRWPALVPVIIVSFGFFLVGGMASAQDVQLSKRVHKILLVEEGRVVSALKDRNADRLRRSGDKLGSIVDQALVRKKRGNAVSACEFAAQSLANMAIFVAHGMGSGNKDWQRLTLEASVSDAENFKQDMKACEREVGVSPRNHNDVVKVLKALLKNGKS